MSAHFHCSWRWSIAIAVSGLILCMRGRAIPAADPVPARASQAQPADPTSASPEAGKPVAREGTELVDRLGRFEAQGGRFVFRASTGDLEPVVLENLMLQRVVQTMRDHPGMIDWRIRGTVTEFQGENYLLLSRVVIQATSQEP